MAQRHRTHPRPQHFSRGLSLDDRGLGSPSAPVNAKSLRSRSRCCRPDVPSTSLPFKSLFGRSRAVRPASRWGGEFGGDRTHPIRRGRQAENGVATSYIDVLVQLGDHLVRTARIVMTTRNQAFALKQPSRSAHDRSEKMLRAAELAWPTAYSRLARTMSERDEKRPPIIAALAKRRPIPSTLLQRHSFRPIDWLPWSTTPKIGSAEPSLRTLS